MVGRTVGGGGGRPSFVDGGRTLTQRMPSSTPPPYRSPYASPYHTPPHPPLCPPSCRALRSLLEATLEEAPDALGQAEAAALLRACIEQELGLLFSRAVLKAHVHGARPARIAPRPCAPHSRNVKLLWLVELTAHPRPAGCHGGARRLCPAILSARRAPPAARCAPADGAGRPQRTGDAAQRQLVRPRGGGRGGGRRVVRTSPCPLSTGGRTRRVRLVRGCALRAACGGGWPRSARRPAPWPASCLTAARAAAPSLARAGRCWSNSPPRII